MSLNTGGIYFSSEEFQPETTPLESLTKLTAGYGIVGGALYASTRYRFDKSSDRGITAFDLAQKYVRNAMENTPFSVGNTFRLAEYMSPFMSGAGKGLAFDAAGQFFYENFSQYLFKFLKNGMHGNLQRSVFIREKIFYNE